MQFHKRILSLAILSLASIASANVSAATYTVTQTGSAGTLSPVTDTWNILVSGEGILEITLVQADYSEWFEWNLSGTGSGSDAFSPVPWTGPVNTSLGTWANGAGTGAFTFTATNYPSHPNIAQDYSIEFSFTPVGPGDVPGIDYITVTPVSNVPLPAAAWLFTSGLVGLVGMSRRSRGN